jgi:1-acylglycerone phosphate reductase
MISPTSTLGRIVLITGCSEGGIGFHLYVCSHDSSSLVSKRTHILRCEEFVRQGCVVFAAARSVSKMAALGDSVHKLRLDVTSDEDVARAVQEVMNMVGRIDILVNNAGIESAGV